MTVFKNEFFSSLLIFHCDKQIVLSCNLSLNEKLEISTYQGKNLLNKRKKPLPKCRHFNKLLLMNFEDHIMYHVMASHECPIILPLNSLRQT